MLHTPPPFGRNAPPLAWPPARLYLATSCAVRPVVRASVQVCARVWGCVECLHGKLAHETFFPDTAPQSPPPAPSSPVWVYTTMSDAPTLSAARTALDAIDSILDR